MFREFVKDNLPKDILPELTFLEKRKEILEAVKEKAKDDEKPAEVKELSCSSSETTAWKIKNRRQIQSRNLQ